VSPDADELRYNKSFPILLPDVGIHRAVDAFEFVQPSNSFSGLDNGYLRLRN
jgi:hypothetical protein